jgi:hypothetical protein
MNRTKLNIRMDLLRVAKAALDLSKPFEVDLANVFINKARQEFDNSLKDEVALKDELISYQTQIPRIRVDNTKRLHWGEKIMTIASRLGTL